jgi:hypothetical protein
MPGSDWVGSFYARHPSAQEITQYSEEVAKGLEGEPQVESVESHAGDVQQGGKQAKKPRVNLEKRSKKELLERAKQKKIKGRSTMNKMELVAALRRK